MPESKLLYVQVKVQGERFNCLLDCGASHNFISRKVVQALELPVLAAAERLQVKLPNGNQLDCNTICKVHLEFPGQVVIKTTFAVVEMDELFVLGMSFL